MYASRLRVAASALPRQPLSARAFAVSARQLEAAATSSSTTSTPASTTEQAAQAPAAAAAPTAVTTQAPNRTGIWSRSQQPRVEAMTGPRFEQTNFEQQPRPYAAIELIHKQPVRWTHDRVVACDGGGGAAGHPKIFINTDKPEIATCGYCGLPFANEHHRHHLESLPETSYPI
ncbi:lactobacillus shifted protein [Staphylotrichum tortipilum]|uniref:Lactobacillus shifted protein n=1 Tax=Staphylotrichum tortipilum TaxID=2831512 RepID=A0AAN6RU16_9PEZI|nr:lactobacillus shifted protein [Staphylotrichum longicolle]